MRARLLSPPLLILSSTLSLIACDTPAIDQPIPTIVPSETPAATASPDLTLTAAPYYTPIISATRTPLATATALPADFTPDTPAPVPAIDIPAEPETAVAYYPPDTRVDVPVLDAIIQAVTTHDAERLQDLIHFSSMGCTHTLGMGGPPKCRAGETDGTPVEVLSFLGSEGSFLRKDEIGSWTGIAASGIYAVYEVNTAVISSEQDYPVGKYVILLVAEENQSLVAVRIGERGIVRVDTIFDSSPESLRALVEREASTVILTPKS